MTGHPWHRGAGARPGGVVAIRGEVGYQTHLARSDDLLHWTPLGLVLPFSGAGWDRWQADGGAALVDPTWGGSGAIEPYGRRC